MAQNKYLLPKDVKLRCLAIIKGYKRMYADYADKRGNILYGSVTPDGQPRGSNTSDTSAMKAIRLAELDETPNAKAITAVDYAKIHIGSDIRDVDTRKRLVEAIWDSCEDGRHFVFEYTNLPMSKSHFYERRNLFLYELAKILKYI